MKNFILLLFIVVGCVINAGAQSAMTATNISKPITTQEPVGGLGEMKFETETHNFDTLENGANGSFEFKFKNIGTEPIVISDARGSCGCTVPTYPKDVPVKPGESQIIKVTYDTKRTGAFTKTVTINSNAKNPVKVLTIKGYVKAPYVEPTFSIDGKSSNGSSIPFEKH